MQKIKTFAMSQPLLIAYVETLQERKSPCGENTSNRGERKEKHSQQFKLYSLPSSIAYCAYAVVINI